MKRIAAAAILLLLIPIGLQGQIFRSICNNGFYFQWGYNRDHYSKSDMHFSNGDKYDFILHDVRATDQPDYEAFFEKPMDITIPQNSVRLGFYLNEKRTHAIELNFDHAKYVMVDGQKLRMTGDIGTPVNADTIVTRYFIHVEHTDGANFLMLNYVGQAQVAAHKKLRLTAVWKAGAGIVVPRSEVIFMGQWLDNRYHVAGYVAGAEGGLRFYFFKGLFFEGAVKGGFANYLDALALEGGRFSHSFYFAEVIGSLGYELSFKRKKAEVQAQ